ncbi:MAG: tetratricopeptide repeat protein [Bdellovibrionaceae bacterium]|nr:tetratricopeptide repeat protein [Pseudobdellovibrionaceae bacterium]MDW8190840.1 tetratricopeptide repeat protein [Pseudobdellovibrionaceae bacterium]
MRFVIFSFVSFLACVQISGCATSPQMLIESQPSGAEAEFVLPSGELKKLGQTPLTVKFDEYQKLPYVFLQLSKENIRSELILIPKQHFATLSELNVNLSTLENKRKNQGPQQSEFNDEALSRAILAQQYVYKKDYEEAQNILLTLVSKYPNSATLWGMLGNAYYLGKKKTKSIEAYERALMLNPQATEIRIMLDKISKE